MRAHAATWGSLTATCSRRSSKSPPRGAPAQPRHVLTLGTKYRPFDGKVGMSRAWHYYHTGDHSVWGGWSWIDRGALGGADS